MTDEANPLVETSFEPHDAGTWKANPGPQTTVLARREDEIMMGGARGGSKTETGMIWMVLPKYINHPLYAGLVIRRNADDLTSWIERARHMYGCLGAVFSGKPPIIRFPSGAYIKLGHLKDENAYTKYQGHEYQKINVEELTQIPTEESYLKLISSSRSTVPELSAQVFSSCNPGGAGHLWVKKRFVDVARNKTYYTEAKVAGKTVRRSRIFIPAYVTDCPQIMENDPGYIVLLESYPEMLREAWLHGNWDVFFGQFFDQWNPEIHVVEPFQIPEQWNRYRGFDWGYAKPSACVWITVDPKGNHYLYREFYEKNNAPNIVAQKIQMNNYDKDGNPENIVATYADPSIWAKNQYGKGKWKEQATAKSINDTFVENGFYCQKANNDRLSGWAKIRQILHWDENKKPQFYVFKDCKNTIRTIPGLICDDHRPEDCDTDGEDHIPDAIRYCVMHTYHPRVEAPPKTVMQELIERITTPVSDSTWMGDNY